MKQFLLVLMLLVGAITAQGQGAYITPTEVKLGSVTTMNNNISGTFGAAEYLAFSTNQTGNPFTTVQLINVDLNMQEGSDIVIQTNQLNGTVATFTFNAPLNVVPRPAVYRYEIRLYADGLAQAYTVFQVNITSARPLPVELASFTGKVDAGRVNLAWTTAQELRSSHFEVQTSADATTFTTVARVAAAGSSSAQRRYTQSLPLVSSTVYCRLHMVDTDGSDAYSNVLVFSSSEVATRYSVSLGDNYYDFQLAKGETPVSLHLFDYTGRPLATQSAANTTLPASGIVVLLTNTGKRYTKHVR